MRKMLKSIATIFILFKKTEIDECASNVTYTTSGDKYSRL